MLAELEPDLYVPGQAIEDAWRAKTWEASTPPVFLPLMRPSRYKGAFGGRGGMKSHRFGEMMIQRHVKTPGTRSVCIREVQKSLDQSVKRLLEDKIAAFGFSEKFRILHSIIETPGDGIILFQGMQDHTADSIKSLEGCDIAWVEEAQTLSDRSLTLLRPTIRKEGSELWFSWNPQEPTDPVDQLFRGGSPPPSSVCVETNWQDNPFLPQAFREEIEWDRSRSPDKFAHVWEGAYRKLSEARVFKNWRVEEFETSDDASFVLGADWGFSVDPSVLVRAYFDSKEPRVLRVDRECYEVGCEIEDTPALFDGLTCEGACPQNRDECRRPGHGWARRWEIVADSARPETISHLKRHGYPKIGPSIKGAKSVEEGVQFLQSYDIVVHPRCQHTINELTYYSYKTDELTGRVLPMLLDRKNHVIDSLRYAVEQTRRALTLKRGLLA